MNNKKMEKVITRFAPSPTGPLHVGGARTALFNFLFTRQRQGKFYLRIEDTDTARSKREFEQNILDGLAWLGLEFDNSDLIRQSERKTFYQAQLEQLLEKDSAYISAEVGEDGQKRNLIRFRNPGSVVHFTDLIRGPITFKTQELGDFVIAKSLTEPLYHFAVVADDAQMGVTHVIRGDDHIANTPRQILIQRALNAPTPDYAHLPLILAPDRSKLSKRRGAVSVSDYRNQGYLPSAILNFLALLGWHPRDDREIFNLSELIINFDFSRIQKGGAIFNLEKLNWLNREHLRQLSDAEFINLGQAFVPPTIKLEKILPVVRERIANFGELRTWAEAGEYDYFFTPPKITTALLGETKELLELKNILLNLPAQEFTVPGLRKAIMPYADQRGRRAVLWPWRVALTGREKSVDPFTTSTILGREETIRRIDAALIEK